MNRALAVTDYAPLDAALARLAGGSADRHDGMTNHAPMVAEALCALGRPEAVLPWVESYRPKIRGRQPARERIDLADWGSALSREDRFSDWSDFFGEELARDPWRDVLERWVGRLAPGICAAATHGVIRVGHAARALGVGTSRLRITELADALASWASTYQELPTSRRTGARRFAPRDAIAHVAVVPPAQRRFTGTIVSSLEGLAHVPAFAPVIDILDTRGEPVGLVMELNDVFARVFVDNAHDTLSAIVFTHTVTSVAAFGNLLPHIDPATARAALPYVWQSACALYATFAAPERPRIARESDPLDSDTVIDRAIVYGDEHAIKLAEACRTTEAPSRALVLLPCV